MSSCHIKQGKIRTMDNHDKATRSYNMSRIRSVNTKPEEMVRKYLFSKGFRYRKNDKRLLGKSYMDFVAETAQVSPDMPAAAILAALSVCLRARQRYVSVPIGRKNSTYMYLLPHLSCCLTLLGIIVTTVNTIISVRGISMKTFHLVGAGLPGVSQKSVGLSKALWYQRLVKE